MKLYCRLVILFILILSPVRLQGQESLFPSSNEFPSFTPFSEDYISTYIAKSKECLYRGDLEGLESNIEILKDLNIHGDPRISGMIQNHSGILEYYKGNIADALKHYLNALTYFNEAGEMDGLNTLMNNIAIIFVQIEDLESTKKYLEKALSYTPENEINRRSVYMLNLAETEALSGDWQKGIKIASDLLELFDPDQIDFEEISIYGILISCYNNLNDKENAEKYIKLGLESISSETQYLDLQSFYSSVVAYYHKTGDYKKVLEYGKIIYPPPDRTFFHELSNTIEFMTVAARETGELNYASKLNEIANEIEFSRAPLNKEDIINPLMLQYSHQRSIKDKELSDREFQENNTRELIQRRFLRQLVFIIFIMFVPVIFLLRTNRLRRRYQDNLRLKNEKLQKINEELVSNNLILEKENRVLDTLISIFAHDLINPFQAILGFSQLIINDHHVLKEENMVEYSGILSETSFQLNQLLTNLDSMAIVQDSDTLPEKNSFRIKNAVKNICKLFEGSLKNKDISINCDAIDDIKIQMNRGIFDAVLRNLVSNAIKFSYRNSEIIISSDIENNQPVLKVTDNGIGLPESIKKELLSKGYPESRSGTSNERGSGIGLVICVELLEMIGAGLDIISKEYKGTTIILKLPVNNA